METRFLVLFLSRQKPIISKTGNSKQSCRSKSCSPTKISNRIATSPNRDRRPASSAKSKEKAPSSTTSETSDVEKVEVLMANQTITDSYVINTRSKTLNTTSKEIKDVNKYGSARNVKKPVTSSISPNGQNLSDISGKAMATPINKRLALQRDNNKTMSAGSEKTSICFGRKQTSNTSGKAETRQSSNPSSREASKPRLPTRDLSSANEKSRGYSNLNPKCLYAKSIPATGSLSQTITSRRTSLSPGRQSVERKCYETRIPSPNAKVKTAQMVYSQNASGINSGTSLSNNFSRNRIPVVRNGSSTKENLNPTQAVSLSRSTSRESQNGKCQKLQFCRNIKSTINTSTNHANHSSRSFKPQLEDIKSSYLLLNQKEMEKNIKKQISNVKNGLGLHSYEFGRVSDYCLDLKVKEIIKDVTVSKPPLLNEDLRQSILKESMRRYRTKQFWNDSKYDKIEGLNWISWK